MSAPPSPSIPSTATSSRTTSPSGSTQQHQSTAGSTSRRPNRAALRDYYNLKTQSPSSSNPAESNPQTGITSPTDHHHHHPGPTSPPTSQPTTPSAATAAAAAAAALDSPTFSPPAYIHTLLTSSPLSTVLRTEAALITEIKGLDGERKALVYDNYSKLITATDTIRRMRRDMVMGSEQEMAGKGVLGPAVGHIADTVGRLRDRGSKRGKGVNDEGDEEDGDEEGGEGQEGRRRRMRMQRMIQRDTVRWVIDAPKRLQRMVDGGDKGEAEEEWVVVRGLLEKWKGVDGVEDVREQCERIVAGG